MALRPQARHSCRVTEPRTNSEFPQPHSMGLPLSGFVRPLQRHPRQWLKPKAQAFLNAEGVTERSPESRRQPRTLGGPFHICALNAKGVTESAAAPSVTPSALRVQFDVATQGAPECRRPWAMFCNRFAVAARARRESAQRSPELASRRRCRRAIHSPSPDQARH